MTTVEAWLEAARADATRRGLDALLPLLDSLAASTRALRAAGWEAAADAPNLRDPSLPDVAPWHPGPPGDASPSSDAHGTRVRDLDPLTVLAARVARGEVTARDLVGDALDRIARLNGTLNAVITTLGDAALAAAERADADRAAGRLHGPLHGIPMTLKDLVDVAGVPTTAASNVRRAGTAERDAMVTERLRRAGAIIVAKTNLHEFAFGTTNEDSAFGPARHPDDPARSPGGSSGGSAAAVRTGMCAASIGTDTGGSIRIPSAACGLVGLKGTFGEVPTDGVVPLAWTLDHVGPLARTVDDAWLLQDVLRGRMPSPETRPGAPRPGALRLVLLEEYFCEPLEDGVRRAFFAALASLAGAGVRVARGTMRYAALIGPVYLHVVFAESAAYHASALERRPQDYTAPVRLRLELARYVMGEDYARAMHARARLTREVDALLDGADALVLPTLPLAAPRLGEHLVTLEGRREPVRNVMLKLTQLFDLTGHPTITLPVGDAAPGLPAGLQLVGRRGDTDALLAVARACEGILRSGTARDYP